MFDDLGIVTREKHTGNFTPGSDLKAIPREQT